MANAPVDLHPFRSFRLQLALWFGGLSLAMLLAIGLYVGRLAMEELATQAGESLYAGARSAADLLATNLRERDQEIRLLRQSPLFMRGDLAGIDMQRSLQLRRQAQEAYAWIGVADASGRVLQATDGILVGQQVAQRPWFQAARTAPYTGDVHEALLLARLLPQQDSGQPLRFIDFAAPILDERGRLRGVLGAHAHWSWVTRTVESVVHDSLRARVEVLIADRAGRIIYPLHLVGQSQLPAGAAPDEHFRTLRWGDGREYLTSTAEVRAETSTPLGWQIVLRHPLDLALEPVSELRNRLLLLGLLAVLVFVTVAYRLASRMSSPIEQLAETMRQVEQRAPAPVYPTGPLPHELQQLNRSIQSMTTSLLQHEEALRQLNASLEQQVRERTEALTEANAQLEKLATIDFLTGLNNRRSFNTRLQESFQLMHRSGRTFCVLLIDADYFKRINDTHGHAAGDEVLRLLGRLLLQTVRTSDFVARYGGEEFVVLVPDMQDDQQAFTLAEKIRQAVAQASFPGLEQVTVSLGVSCARTSDHSASEVLRRADEALYQAKHEGRNRVITA